jgi:hypothetical protein
METKIPVGTPVHYYPEGIKFNKSPVAGTVLEYNGNGICTIETHTSSIRSSVKVNVWHVDAQELADNEHLRILYGAWDYHPWFMPPQAAVTPEPAAPAPAAQVEERKKTSKVLVGTDA